MKSVFNQLIHKILLPRGRTYDSDKTLEAGWEKVTLEGENKKKISVLFQKPDKKTIKGVVLLSHPYVSDAKQFFLKSGHAEMYLKNGFMVIIPDFNGFGESPFQNFDYTTDLVTVGNFFTRTYHDIPFFGHGISFGASNLINYCTTSNHILDKIIVENCLDSNLSYYKNRNQRLFFIMKGLMKIFPSLNKHHDYTKSISQLKHTRDILFIYNLEDTLTTIHMGKQIMTNCVLPCHMEIFKGKHLEAYVNEPVRYREIIVAFLSGLTK
ncbi:MAG: hypothetical protein H7X99_10125 [Saprospiraceae bacterium]|nr:hypothetical protein [Saprospiraceae bacterium]